MNSVNIKSLYRVSEIGIHYKYKMPYQDKIEVNKSSVAYEILKSAWDQNKIELLEQFKILLLDNRCSCIGIVDIASGSITPVSWTPDYYSFADSGIMPVQKITP